MSKIKLLITFGLLLWLILISSACSPRTIDVGCFVNELVDAINTANASPNPDTIELEADCVYLFRDVDNYTDRQGTPTEEDGGNALPVIYTTITINGNDARFMRDIVQGTPEFRFFKIITDGDLTLNDISMENGEVQSYMYNFGGAIWNAGGVLTLNNVSLTQNSAEDGGGAIENSEGEVTINESSLTENSANWGGAIRNRGTLTINGGSTFSNNSAVVGGAIDNRRILTIYGLSGGYTLYGITFESNSAGNSGGAISSSDTNGNAQLSIRRVVFRDNTSGSYGGAVNAELGHQTFEILGSSFTGNYSGTYSGAVNIREIGSVVSVIEDTSFKGNTSGENGGAIKIGANSPSTINNCEFDNNSAVISGGAILSYSDMSISSSQFTANTAGSRGGGVFAGNVNNVVSLDDVLVENNYAGVNGGGIYLSYGPFNIANSVIQGNQADMHGGGIFNEEGIVTISAETRLEDNTAQHNGGGICNCNTGEVTLQDGIVQDNEAGFSGGGIYNWSVMTIQTSAISGNSAVNHGGGLTNEGGGELNILRSTINNNTALVGSGIAHSGGGLTILNSTISGNDAQGSAVYIGMDADIIHTTIAHNNATHSSSEGLLVDRAGTLSIKNSIVAYNSPSDCDIWGILTPTGENLDSDGTCSGFTLTADPVLVLGPLANNGGSTETHALLAGSPAIDAAHDCYDLSNPSVLVTYDQRGESRPEGAACDLGAYEFVPVPPPPPSPFPITFIVNVNCRIGPHYDHVVVFTYQEGETANAVGRNEDGSWLAVDGGNTWCWVPDELLDHDLDVFILPVREHLLSPDQLVPKDDEEGCWWDVPLDNKAKVCKSPCPNDIYSSGSCTP